MSFLLKTKLLQHQKNASDKLLPITIGGLFMDMGTGKTRTNLELIFLRQDKISNVVWFCPVSLKQTIKQEIIKHTNVKEENICVFNDITNETNTPLSCITNDIIFYIVGLESVGSSPRVVFNSNLEILGFCTLFNEKNYIYYDNFYIIKEHRNKGFSKILFDYRLGYCYQFKKNILAIVDNKIQEKNYIRNNFEIIGKRGHYNKWRKNYGV